MEPSPIPRRRGRHILESRRDSGSDRSDTLRPANGTHPAFVLHDEFDLRAQHGARVCTHSLLLSAGLELHIRFANLRFRRFGHVWLANSKPLDLAREWTAADLLAAT
jgi:hypothetical protein